MDVTSKPEQRIDHRVLSAFVMILSGACLPLTGLAVHLTQDQPLTLARHAAMAAHTGLALTFLVFAVWHVSLNRRPLMNYLRRITAMTFARNREVALAVAVVAGVLLVFIGHVFHVQ